MIKRLLLPLLDKNRLSILTNYLVTACPLHITNVKMNSVGESYFLKVMHYNIALIPKK